MLVIDYRSKTAIYEQIKTQIMELIAVGSLRPHDQLPSLRALAAELDLNFNTVKKAFGELESAGVIYSLAGRGCFVAENALENRSLRQRALEMFREGALTARAAGIPLEEAGMILQEIYGRKLQEERRET